MKGIEVVVGVEKGRSLASSSRYCKTYFSYPSPDSDPQAFLHAVLGTTERYVNPVLFPMKDMTVNEILLNRNLFPENVRIPFSDHDRYDALSDKEKLFRQAKKLAIPMPETLFSSDFTSREALSFSHNSIMPSKPPNTGRGRGIARHYRGVGSGADRYLATVLRESPSRLAICRTGQCCTRHS